MVKRRGVFNCERLTVKEWQRKRGTIKKRRKRSWRSGTSKSHPKKYPEWREAKRRVGFEWLVLWTIGRFLAVPFTLFSTEKGMDCRAETTDEDPH